jgi:hypothetical protein
VEQRRPDRAVVRYRLGRGRVGVVGSGLRRRVHLCRRRGRAFFAVAQERDRARVRHREAALGKGRAGLVAEALLDRRGRLGIVGLAEALPRRAAGGAAELLFEGLQRQRGAHLGAAALAEDAADQRGLRDHVGRLPFGRQLPQRRVLDRHLVGVDQRFFDVGVDAGDEFLDVGDDLFAFRPVHGPRLGELLFEVRFGVRRDHPLRAVHRAVARGAADEGGEFSAGGMAQDVDQEEPVCGSRVAGAEHDAGPRAAVDVRDAEGAVALDRDVCAWAFGGGEVSFGDAEGRVLEVVGDLFLGQRRRCVQQVRVQRQLVGEVGGIRFVELEFGELLSVVEAVLAGRQHVAKAARVVRSIGLRGSRSDRATRNCAADRRARDHCCNRVRG